MEDARVLTGQEQWGERETETESGAQVGLPCGNPSKLQKTRLAESVEPK